MPEPPPRSDANARTRWRRAVSAVVAVRLAWPRRQHVRPARAQEDAGRQRAARRSFVTPKSSSCSRLHPADSARRRPRQLERVARHHQRPAVQRFRDGRPPHLHQHRRLLQAETPNEVIGFSHETGHMAGGHLAKMRQQLAQRRPQMILATLLGSVRWSQARKQQLRHGTSAWPR